MKKRNIFGVELLVVVATFLFYFLVYKPLHKTFFIEGLYIFYGAIILPLGIRALRKHKVKPHEALMVGDSLRSDVTGAMNARMHAVWLNRKGKSFDFAKIKPEFEINTLNDIYSVLKSLNSDTYELSIITKK